MRVELFVLLVSVLLLLSPRAHGGEHARRMGDVVDAVDADTVSADDACNVIYDYIVVGAGAAGSVVATRLAQHGDKVLIIDGGKPSQSSVGGTDYVASSYSFDSQGNAVFNRPLTRYDVPAFCYSATADFPGSPTPYYPLDSTVGPWKTFSKMFGGNSVHNYLVWNRISPTSLNRWGVTNWTYNDVLPYYKKVEDVRGTYEASNPQYHGLSGLIEITPAQVPDPIGAAFIDACGNSGFGKATDFNAPGNYIGCGAPLFNINRRGIRGGAVNQYLAPAIKQYRNLDVIMRAEANKVIFDTSCNPPKATGVRFEKNGVTYTARASKEIILSAGAVGSNKILLLSGVGPASQLAAVGINLIADLPVGKNMSTHPIVFNTYQYNATGVNPYAISSAGVEYAINGTGVYASVGVPAMAQLKSDASQPDFDLHVQLALGGAPHVATLLALRLTFQRDLQIKLKSNNPQDPAFLVFTPFDRNEDVVAFAKTILIFRKIARTAPLNSFLGPEISPGPAYTTQTELEGWVRNGGGVPILTHLHGGAPLGNPGDNKVLDTRARVRKVQNLRVADSSIIPYDIVALPTQNLLAFAEKIVAYIIADN